MTPKAFELTPTAFELTPTAFDDVESICFERRKAFANFSPGLELATTLGLSNELIPTLKALARDMRTWPTLSAFQCFFLTSPRVGPTLG
jgi:hypothetical protein